MHDRVDTTTATTPAGGVGTARRGTLSITPLHPDDFDDWARARAASFGRALDTAGKARLRAVTDPARALAVREGTEIVGTAHAGSRSLTVPNGRVAAAHVTAVSVLPTHRRRGILSAMMDRQLSDIAERGEPVAVLSASEAGIYRRYGYGVAAEKATLEIARDHARFAAPPPVDPGRVRLVDRSTALARLPAAYDAVRVQRAGMLSRAPVVWSHQTLSEDADDGATHYAIHETDEGQADSYAVYRTNIAWRDSLPVGDLIVSELLASSPATEEVLWRYMAGVDLVAKITARGRPVDDALTWMSADPRRLQRRPADALWLRLLDIPTALSARAYGATDALVLQVIDDRVPGRAAGTGCSTPARTARSSPAPNGLPRSSWRRRTWPRPTSGPSRSPPWRTPGACTARRTISVAPTGCSPGRRPRGHPNAGRPAAPHTAGRDLQG